MVDTPIDVQPDQSHRPARAGFKEHGTTTTPFDMVVLNGLDRLHLVMDIIDRLDGLPARAAVFCQRMADARLAARRYTREHGEDDARIAGWT